MATNLSLDGNIAVAGSAQEFGDAVTDTIGFYGSAKVAQPASASQAAVTLTLVTAVVLTAVTALATTAPTKTTTTYGFTTSTQAAAIVARVNQLKVDVATIKARVDQAKVDLTAANVLITSLRKALVPTTGVGLIKGAA